MPEATADDRQRHLKRHRRNTLLALLTWTVLIIISLAWNVRHNRTHAADMALDRARTVIAKDISLRRWATSHGGVYVPATAATPPNTYLSHLPERDITTPSGRHLTLMNPAYMLRQIVTHFSDPSASAHLTSLKPMRPENTPDSWEMKALRDFDKGSKEAAEILEGPTGSIARVMKPFYVDHPNCLSCHSTMGYRLGDVRGGISATVSLTPYLKAENEFTTKLSIYHGAVWLLGITAIGAVTRRNRKNLLQQLETQKQLADSRHFLEEIIDGIQDLVLVIDREYRIVLSNWHGVPEARQRKAGDQSTCYRCLHDRIAPCDDCHLSKVFSGQTVVLEKSSTYDGRHREITAYPYRDAGGRVTMAIEIVRDVEDRHSMESNLRASEERFRHFAEKAQDIIYRLRLLPQPTIEYTSPAVAAITGYPLDEWRGDTAILVRIVHPDDAQQLLDILSGKLPADDMFTIRIIAKNGKVVWTEHRITPILDQEGRVEAIDGICRDISRQTESTQKIQNFSRELERRVAERTAELELSTRELEEFCHSIAHDFRGPLRSINSNAHLLEVECPHVLSTPVCSETLRKIRTSTTLMGNLMDLLLELGRISRSPLYPEELDLSAICRRLAGDMQRNDPERDVLLTIPEGMMLTADSALMERLMGLLLANAWKFTARKAVGVIEIQQTRSENETVVMVRDNGAGFDMAHAANLFKPFQRLHRYDEFAGPGMGLAIARRIVERHGGRIWAEGEPDGGALFSFAIPFSRFS